MSLINDALKKAQRDRDPLAPTDALGAGPSGRSKARTPARHWLLVLGSGALVLVVLSVAFTLFWTTPDAPPRKAAAVAPAARPAATTAGRPPGSSRSAARRGSPHFTAAHAGRYFRSREKCGPSLPGPAGGARDHRPGEARPSRARAPPFAPS
jgi:hypothetical protein